MGPDLTPETAGETARAIEKTIGKMNGTTAAKKTSIGDFIREVRQETSKVTWPTRKETLITTGMVFAMSILAAIFFFFVDQILAFGVRLILGLGG